jgi:hypothetical protein
MVGMGGVRGATQTFATARDAKEFLVARIVSEAAREGVPLSETERKMLYFSETAWTLPDMMEVNDAFDREYDQAEYEEKIGALARNFRDWAMETEPSELEAWDEAVRALSAEDHYLLVLLNAKKRSKDSRLVDRLKLIGLAFLIVVVWFMADLLLHKR